MIAQQYYERVLGVLEKAATAQRPSLDEAADRIAQSLTQGGLLHIFGSGHSIMIGKEITSRAGGLVPVNLVPDPTEGMAERLEGLGEILLDRYARRHQLLPGEVIIVVSTSGRNPVPIDVALKAREMGLYVIAVTSLEYSKLSTSRHSSGKRLFEVADLALDNFVPPGDASVEIPGTGQKAGALSTISGALVVNMLMLQVIDRIVEVGEEPPILRSYNLDGADEHNQKLFERYRSRLVY